MTIFVFNGLKSANANLMVPEVDVPVRFPIHERDEAYLSETSVTVTDAQGIYLYPNAQNVTEEPSYIGAPWRHIIDYDVPVSSEHVLVFYKAQLAKTGWVDGGPSIYGTPSTLYAGFDWLDPAGVTPYWLTFSVRVEPLSPERTHVSTWLEQIPDATKVPLYPDAQQVQISLQPEPLRGHKDSPYHLRLTTYFSSADPSAIEEYYKVVMVQNGRALHDKYDVAIESGFPGYLFSYFRGNPHHHRAGNVSLLAEKDTSGLTKVEIRASGDDIEPPPSVPALP